MAEHSGAERPLLRVVRGNPDDAELAALTVVLSAIAAGAVTEAPARPRSVWSDPWPRLRRPMLHGPGAWRASGLPR